MASDQQGDREGAIRAMLVERAGGSRRGSWTAAVAQSSDRRRAGLATAIVLVVVVALSVFAIRVGGGLRGAPTGADAPVAAPTGASIPVPSRPPGVELGRFSSADGPKQTHVIRPDGLALATAFACEGGGEKETYLIHVPHAFDEGGSCGGTSGGGAGDKGTAGSVTVSISSTDSMRWTLIVTGVPETYVTPQPVETPLDAAGSPVPFCTDQTLKASFEAVPEPDGVTEVSGGQLRFEDVSAAACALAGHPMVRFVDEDGQVLGHHTMDRIDERSSTEKGLRPVVLQPGGVAYSQIDWYLPNYYPENDEGDCVQRTVHLLRVDLANRLAGAAQTGFLVVPVPAATACLNGAHGVDGKYGQLSSTVFVDYSLEKAG